MKTRYPIIIQGPQFGGKLCPGPEDMPCEGTECPSEQTMKYLRSFLCGY